MVEVYRVGVTFALNNLVSAELKMMAGEFSAVDKAAKSFASTLKTIGGVGSLGGTGAFAGVSAAAKGMGQSFSYAAAEIDGVRQKLNGLKKAAAQDTGFWGSGSGFAKTALKGAAAFAGFEGIKGGMSMEDTIARAMVAMGVRVGPDYMYSGMAKGIQNSIFDTSTSYGVNLADTQDAALQTLRALAPLSPDQRNALLPSILKFAGAEVLGKHGTTMEEAAEAGIGLAHQLRAYTPEQIEPLLGAFAKLSMASPQSLSQMSRASSYYLPLLTAGLGMDPTELMALGTVGSQMGLNTKAGTWLADMFQAPFTSDLTSKRGSARRSALQALGVVDANGKPVTKDPFEFLQIVSAHASSMSSEERMKDFVAGFGKQGARGAAIFTDPAVLANIAGLASGLKTAPTPDALNAQYGNSPMVKFNRASEEFMKTLTKLGEQVMPQVTSTIWLFTLPLKVISGALDGIDWLTKGAADRVRSALGVNSTVAPARPNNQSPIVIDHNTTLDGRVIANSVTEYQVQGLAKVPDSGSSFDGRMSFLPVN